MKGILTKIASVLSIVIGTMAVFAGGRVLLGIDPGYYVINWVPIYNFSMGLISLFVTAVLLWRNHPFGLKAAGLTLAAHSIVMIVLQTVYRSSVAAESIQAMTVRIIVWVTILILMIIHVRSEKSSQPRIVSKPRSWQ